MIFIYILVILTILQVCYAFVAIITSDDPTLSHKKLDGYEIKNIDYGKNREILRQIIKKRLCWPTWILSIRPLCRVM